VLDAIYWYRIAGITALSKGLAQELKKEAKESKTQEETERKP